MGLQPEETIAAAWRELRARGHRVSLRGVRRLYALHQLRVDRGDFLPWLLTYADTTGETAVWKVVAGGASA